jgi:hypothetical protein
MTKIYRTTLSLKKALREQKDEREELDDDVFYILDPDDELEEMITRIKNKIRTNFKEYLRDNPELDPKQVSESVIIQLEGRGGGYLDDLVHDIFVELDEDGVW